MIAATAKIRKAETPLHRPPILLKEGKQPIRLRLRAMSFNKELDQLPSEAKTLVEMMLQSRVRENAGTYEVVMFWNRLKNQDNQYWKSFGFGSEQQFLVHYLLPDGHRLGFLTAMVQLFEKTTFTVLGEEVLLHLITSVSQYQKDPDQKKRDYRAIFDRYNRATNAFDRRAFFDGIRRYVADVYEKPMAEAAGKKHEDWLKQQARERSGKRSGLRVVETVVVGNQSLRPSREQEFEYKQQECAACSSKMEIIYASAKHIALLESIIREKCGEEAVPPKPDILRNV